MLSVADILKAGLLTGSRVVAGESGLNRIVAWVHNAGVPDAPMWLNGGELVLTTYINMPSGMEEQRDYMRQMVDKNVAGLCLTVGRYIDKIPAHLMDVANEYQFPLIEIPYTARFVDIAKGINERISQNNMQIVERALSINQRLTQIVLEGGDLPDLANALAGLVGHSISIENERFEAIATVNIADVDEARRYTQLHGQTDPRLVQALEERDYLPRLRASLRPVHLPPMPDVGLEMERMLAPIVVHGAIYGWMWIIADDHALSEIDMMAIESGATIAAMLMLYQESAQHAEASLKGNLLSRLIEGDEARDTVLTDQSLRYGVDLRAPFIMLVVDDSRANAGQMLQIYRLINQLASMGNWRAVVGQYAGQVVILAEASDAQGLAQRILDRLALDKSRDGSRARIGVSAIHQGAPEVRPAHQQCRDALAIMMRLSDALRVVHFNELGYLHTLYQAGAQALQMNPDVPIVRRLLDEKSHELFHTLEAYLDAGGNGVATAENMHIHRSTLNYRLAQIEKICGVKLQDPMMRINLQVALKLLRLFEV